MESLVDRHSMSERQKKFRAEYQAQIHPLYSGPVHIGVIYLVGLSVIAWCVSRMQNATWEWLLVVPVFLPKTYSDRSVSGRTSAISGLPISALA
jgi:hypothetical protein